MSDPPDWHKIMYSDLARTRRPLPLILGIVTLTGVGVLFLYDLFPGLFSAGAHDLLGAFPLAMIAFAYLLYQRAHRPPLREAVKAIMLAAAFLFWAANQFWPNLRQAVLFNDLAIGLFVIDVFLVIAGWPAASPDQPIVDTLTPEEETSTEAAAE
jgi:hypothetical protein